MAPSKQIMPLIIKQVSNMKRLRHGAKSTTLTLNSINPEDCATSYSVYYSVA